MSRCTTRTGAPRPRRLGKVTGLPVGIKAPLNFGLLGWRVPARGGDFVAPRSLVCLHIRNRIADNQTVVGDGAGIVDEGQ